MFLLQDQKAHNYEIFFEKIHFHESKETRNLREFEKKTDLREVSVLNMTICMKELNLNKLIKKSSFTVFSKLTFDEYTVFVTSLADFKVNEMIFIDIKLIVNLIKVLNTHLIMLSDLCDIRDFNKQLEEAITHVVILHL